MNTAPVVMLLACLMAPALHAVESPGQAQREIKSLSVDEIESIKQGQGAGMAKPAELNGYPGPRHVLDLAEDLALSADQRAEIENLFAQMRQAAVTAGERYLKAERKLDEAFRSREIGPASLKALIGGSAQAQAELRYVHLHTHLAMLELLSPHQIARYNRLRGYDAGAPAQHSMHSSSGKAPSEGRTLGARH